jgi:DNA polymerase-3 subunit epsilon
MNDILSKFKNGKISRKLLISLIEKKEDNPFLDEELLIELLISNGLSVTQKNNTILLDSYFTNYKKDTFVFVDIETNGGRPNKHDIIELGAIKWKNGKVVGKINSLIYSDNIPEFVTKITNINLNHLIDAPKQNIVLKKFKEFLGDSIFVAHDVGFDYNFISYKLNSFGLGKLYNRKLCTIKLAQKIIKVPKYNLFDLATELKIDITTVHRAYYDALWSFEIFKKLIKKLPENVKTTNELIEFSKQGRIPKNSIKGTSKK